jgi:imidazolonepropionase-like amidohydrolase
MHQSIRQPSRAALPAACFAAACLVLACAAFAREERPAAPTREPQPAQAAGGAGPAQPTAAQARPRLIYLKAARLFDGLSGGLREGAAVLVEGERIVAAGSAAALPPPAGAEVVDLGDATLLPGLIDCHVHLAERADEYAPILMFRHGPLRAAISAVGNARATLQAGFTTVRDLGSPAFLAADLRDAIAEGQLPGPRIVASGPGISITGGHGDLNGYAPQVSVHSFPEERDFQIADGVDQVRHVVRAQLKHGVDVIKIHASGGVLSRGDQPGAPQFTLDELRAAAEEAHKGGRRIAAHAHGAQSIRDAVLAGIDSIEHGSLIDDEGIRLMAARGTVLVADLYNDDYILQEASKFGIEPEMVEKERKLGQLQRDNFRRAVRAGVKVAFGTDAGVYPHGDNARQFRYYVEYGLTPAQAILSATSAAAALLGRSDLGAVQAGRLADLIAVRGNPLRDVRLLESVPFVMKGGAVVKDQLRPTR